MNRETIFLSTGFSILFIFTVHYFPYASADINMGSITTGTVFTNTPNIISIELSGTCLSMVKINDTSDCPTYKQLIKYDTSNLMLSGKFVTTKGFFHRMIPATLLHYKMYDPKKTIVMVDPDSNVLSYSKEIIIVPKGFVYANPKDNMTNSTRIEYHERYVDNCQTAKISYSDYLLNDTISYLKSDCKITNFHEAVKINTIQHTADYTKTQSYKNQMWYKQVEQINKGNCITHICKSIKDPNSKF